MVEEVEFIHILDNIKYDIIDKLCYSNNICEIANIKILCNNSNIIVSGIYRPPDALSLEFINTIQIILDNCTDISDNLPIFTSFNLKVAKPKIYRHSYIRIINDETISALKKDILLYNWTFINDFSLNVNEVVYKFINSLNILYNKNCPILIKKNSYKS